MKNEFEDKIIFDFVKLFLLKLLLEVLQAIPL
jgi:hypothetical protein